jgi:cell division protein FtsQ
MRAAARTESRSFSKPRGKAATGSAKPRPAKPVSRGPSKLRAVHGAGVSRALTLAALMMVVALAITVTLATGGRGQSLAEFTRRALDTRLASIGLRLDAVHLQGATPLAQGDILRAAAVPLGAPILTLDLGAIRRRVESVGWVERARVIRLFPDTVVIAVDERPLIAVWQHGGHNSVIASNGAVVTQVDPGRFAALPLIVGDGANWAAASILPLLAKRPALARRVQALVRVDERRWNLRLDSGGLIMLPATGEDAALDRFDWLARRSSVLDLGLERIDLRDPDKIVVRPRGGVAPVTTSGGT